jgi:hypothetical protein
MKLLRVFQTNFYIALSKKMICPFVLLVLVQTDSMNWRDSKSVFVGTSHTLQWPLQKYITEFHYITSLSFKKKKIPGRGFIVVVLFCCFAKGLLENLHLKFPAGKD